MNAASRSISSQAAPALLPTIASVAGFYFAARLGFTYLFFHSDRQIGVILSLTLMLFIVIRGFADTERFDLSRPLWSTALLSLMFTAIERQIQATA